MMDVMVLIASETDGEGQSVFRAGDRAAVQWGMAIAGTGCRVRIERGDRAAATYAAALHAKTAEWDPAESMSPELVLIGPGAAEVWGDEVAGRLAERLQAELVCEVQRIERSGTTWVLTCDVGRCARDVVTVAGRVVAIVSDAVERPPYVSCTRRALAARSLGGPDNAVARTSAGWQPVAPRRKRATASALLDSEDRANAAFGINTSGVAGSRRSAIADAPAICAQVLLRYLVHHGFVDRALPETVATVVPASGGERPAASGQDAVPVAAAEFSPSGWRGPRGAWDDDRRRARRPRPAVAPFAGRESARGMQRGPRRAGRGERAGRRGPFLVAPGGSSG